MKKSIFTEKDYMITAGINLLSLIFWFLPAMHLSYRGDSEDYALSQIANELDVPFLNFFTVLYIVMIILGFIVAILPLIKKFSGVAAIPDIKDGLFINLQGAPVLHGLFVLFYYIICTNEGRINVELYFAGVVAILLGIGCIVWHSVMKSRYKKNKRALKNEQNTNNIF